MTTTDQLTKGFDPYEGRDDVTLDGPPDDWCREPASKPVKLSTVVDLPEWDPFSNDPFPDHEPETAVSVAAVAPLVAEGADPFKALPKKGKKAKAPIPPLRSVPWESATQWEWLRQVRKCKRITHAQSIRVALALADKGDSRAGTVYLDSKRLAEEIGRSRSLAEAGRGDLRDTGWITDIGWSGQVKLWRFTFPECACGVH